MRYAIGGQIDGLKKNLRLLATDAENSGSTSQPTLKDESVFKVHLWDDSASPAHGYREKQLYAKEGFATHPRIALVDSPDDADIIVWVTVMSCWDCEIPPKDYINVVVLDYAGMSVLYYSSWLLILCPITTKIKALLIL